MVDNRGVLVVWAWLYFGLIRQLGTLRNRIKRQDNLGHCVIQELYPVEVNTVAEVLQVLSPLWSFSKDWLLVVKNDATKGDFKVPCRVGGTQDELDPALLELDCSSYVLGKNSMTNGSGKQQMADTDMLNDLNKPFCDGGG
jgi:hypothetical protein